jgi:hypothetical protein
MARPVSAAKRICASLPRHVRFVADWTRSAVAMPLSRPRLRCLVARPRSKSQPGQEAAASLVRLLPLGLLSSRREDEPRDFFGTRDQREMAGLHFDGLRAHPLGHEALKVRVDCAVFS